MEEAVLDTGQDEVREDGAGVRGSAGSDELEAKTKETNHPHPTR